MIRMIRENKERSENPQVTFTNSSFLAEIEGGPFEVKKKFFGPKSPFLGREHIMTLVPTQNFEF